MSCHVHPRRELPQHKLTVHRRWIPSSGIVTSLLMPVPYLLVSFAYPHLSTPQIPAFVGPGIAHLSTYKPNDVDLPDTSFSSSSVALSQTLTLTSGTLVLLALAGRIHASHSSLDRRKRTLGVAGDTERKPSKVISVEGARRVAGRVLSVGLPIYASLKLGGGRSSLIMLVAGTGGLLSPEGQKEDLSRMEGWKRLVTARKWTLVTLAVGIISDVLGFTSKEEIFSLGLGYLALALSFFIFPPPFSQKAANGSVVQASRPTSATSTSAVPATPWEGPSVATRSPSSLARISPLISTTQDTHLTLLTGVLSLIIVLLTSILSSSNIHPETPLQWLCFALAIIGGASALVISQPMTLNLNPKWSFLVGSSSLLFISNIFSASTWTSCSFQAILVGLSYIGVQLNKNSITSPGVHKHHHHHRVDEHHAKNHELKSSKLTTLLLKWSQRWPLLHSILLEKDSRRIFYFMRYVQGQRNAL